MPDLSLDIVETRPSRGAAACPGLFRVVPARDGGLCRIKLPLGHLTANQARAIAAAARHGNGIVEATNRANLQIRGIAREAEAALVAGLLDADLGPAAPDADDIRNVMVSPTAGFDPQQKMDALPLARTLLAYLQSDAACRSLSPKFSVLVDGGESIAAIDHPHDIWLTSLDENSMALGIAGCPDDCAPFLVVPPTRAIEAVAAAIALFLEAVAHNSEVMRFRHVASDAMLNHLGDRLGVTVSRDVWRRTPPAPLGHIGVGAQRQSGLVFAGAVPPLGRLSPPMLSGLAAVAEEFGDGHLRLTPWQSVIVPAIREAAAPRAVRALEALGLFCDPRDPLASMIACAGSAGCASAFSDTKADAVALARSLAPWEGAPRVVHLSGCAKSCASPRMADATLVASAPGTYELFRKADGTASRFGRSVARDLSIDDAGRRLRDTGAT